MSMNEEVKPKQDDSYKAGRMVEAWKTVNEIPGTTLAAQVEHAMFHNCYEPALRDLCAALRTIDPALGSKFWKLISGPYVSGAPQEKMMFIQEVKRLQPKPLEPVKAADETAAMPATPGFQPGRDLSDELQEKYSIGNLGPR